MSNTLVKDIIQALGGLTNITHIDACLTRLRVVLNDNSLLKKSALKKLGAIDIIKVGDTQQIIFGAKSAAYRDEIKTLISQMS